MSRKRKCHYCDATTYKSLNDFCDIGWKAFQIVNHKSICLCPNHINKLDEVMEKEWKKHVE